MTKLSVIMPVYNTKEAYLREAIESILSQTYTDFEFIIINDGSTNNAEEVILSYQDSRIIYIKQENQGVAKTLNNGINIAKGKYIARMDADDISLKERFEKQIKFLEENPQVSILGTYYEELPKKKIIKNPLNPKFAEFFNGCFVCHPTVMMRNSDLKKYDLRYNPDFRCEDYELWSRAIRYVNIHNLPEVLFKYRWHDNNISNKANFFVESDIKVRQTILNFITEDECLQDELALLFAKNGIKYKFIEKIFSIKNFLYKNKKGKAITIFGITFYIK